MVTLLEATEKELYTLIKMTNKGLPIICICNDLALRKKILSKISSELKEIKIYNLELNSSQKSVVKVIEDTLANKEFQKLQKYKKVVLSISGLENTISEEEWEKMRKNDQRPQSLQILNHQRDYFLTLPHPVLFWVSESLARYLQKFAPDFWAIRCAIFEFKPVEEELAQTIDQLMDLETFFYENIEDINRRIRIYRKLLSLEKDKKMRLYSLIRLGSLLSLKGEYADAINFCYEGLKIAKELGDKFGIAAALHQIAMIYQQRGDYDKAIELYEESIKIKKELGDKSGIAKTLHNVAAIYQDRGDYDKAIELYEEVKKTFEELGDKSGIAATLHNIANVHYLRGDYDKAIELYKESIKIEKELGDKSGIAKTLHNIANVHYLRGDYDKAIELYEESIKIAKELGNKLGVAYTLAQLGLLYKEIGEKEKAIKCMEEALKMFEQMGLKRDAEKARMQLKYLK